MVRSAFWIHQPKRREARRLVFDALWCRYWHRRDCETRKKIELRVDSLQVEDVHIFR